MRIELDDSKKEHLIKGFLNLESFKLMNSNVGDNKEYGDLYSQFKKSFKPSSDYVNKLLDSRYVKHFYSNYEIIELKRKWQ